MENGDASLAHLQLSPFRLCTKSLLCWFPLPGMCLQRGQGARVQIKMDNLAFMFKEF